MEGFSFEDVRALQDLLGTEKDDSDSEDDVAQTAPKKLGPGHIGSPEDSKSGEVLPQEGLKGDRDDIWHPSEVTTVQTTELFDPRVQPEYEIKFKQAVTAEDVFLGMSFKTPSSASCEWLTMSIKMPEEDIGNIDLSVENDFIDIRSPKYRLHLPTPHTVDPNASSAKWHGNSSILELNLRMTRELDPVNF